MGIKITIPNTSSDTLTFGSANTTTAAQIAGIDSGSTNGQLAFYTTATGTSTERMRIDSSGKVGIGTTSPVGNLTVSKAGAEGIEFIAGNVSNVSTTQYYNRSGAAYTANAQDASYHSWLISGAEKARIDSSGNLLVGGTTTYGAVTVAKAAPSAPYGQICAFSPTAGDSNISGMSIVKYGSDTTTAQVMIRFLIGQGANGQGQINANGANTVAFGSYSDSRLKENIVDLPSQLDNIMALRPVEYDYIESMGGGHQIGFVAQEVQAIYPDLVGENEDGMLTLTDMNKNDARLIKAIQEMKAIIDTQASTITQLQADVAVLKGTA